MEWKNIYRGLIMGASDIIPGVSGGTIAVLLGIYDRLIEAINGIFTKEWKKHFKFLLPLAAGVALSIFSLSRVMKWLLKYYSGPTYFFFLGLILGVLPYLFRESKAKETFNIGHVFLLVVGAIALILLPMNPDSGFIIETLTLKTYILLFFAGCLASAAMILPGISGSLVLLTLGAYPTVIAAVSDLNLLIIAIVGTGIFVGIIMMSKVIQYFFRRFRTATFALIIGLVIGSIYVIFPGWPTQLKELILSIFSFSLGLLAAYTLGKVEYE